jgi:mediator of RNA polymerase II transcription subunit 5
MDLSIKPERRGSLGTPVVKANGPRSWQALIKDALARRLRPDQLEALAKETNLQHRAHPDGVARILINLRKTSGDGTDDPLLIRYITALLKAGYVESRNLLQALLKHSSFVRPFNSHRETNAQMGFPSFEERVFSLLMRFHVTDATVPAWKTLELVQAVQQWMHTVCEIEIGNQVAHAGLHSADIFTANTYEALGQLAIVVLRNPALRLLTKQDCWEQLRSSLVLVMEDYDSNVLHWIQSQCAGVLSALTAQPPFIQLDKYGHPIFTDRQILGMIPNVPMLYGRGGLFVWLDSALAARPFTDDLAILSFLQARFPNDIQSLIVNFLTTSFDVLTNAMLRKESRQNVKIIRSFICNKLPVLLVMLSHSIAPPLTAETYIQMPFMAGGTISMDPLPPISAGATDMNETLKATRLEFFQACALHGLVTENGIAGVLNGPIALPRITKLVKETLVTQCSHDIGRLESLIDDLDAMQGNAAAIAGCVVTIITNLCMTKDTMALKTVCSELLKKMPSTDIIMQYTQPSTLLLPLCAVLNEWVHDQDQTEFTPSYEEFATILLYTLASIHRFDLKASDLGLLPSTFIASLTDENPLSHSVTGLTDEQKNYLGKWIESLFALDESGEASGIPDEVMRFCSPVAFYTLVPTLFEQSVIACRTNALSMKTLQGGLELLLEPFLLPSLIMGLGWLAKHSWEDHNDAAILLQILDKLLKPLSSSPEVQSMHRAIIAMVADPLLESLHVFRSKKPENKKALELTTLLEKGLARAKPLQRNFYCNKSQLDALMSYGGRLEQYVTTSIEGLMQWSMNSSEFSVSAPVFGYKQFTTAVQILDGDVLLDSILQYLATLLPSQLSLAVDVCTAIACAPPSIQSDPQQFSRTFGATTKLRNIIQLRAADVHGLLVRPQVEAEVLVQLARQIQAQVAVVQVQPAALSLALPEATSTNQIMQDLGLEMSDDLAVVAAVNNVSLDPTAVADLVALDQHQQQLDLSAQTAQQLSDLTAMQADTLDMSHAQIFGDVAGLAAASVPIQQAELTNAAEEDIFADFDLGDLGDDFNFDS